MKLMTSDVSHGSPGADRAAHRTGAADRPTFSIPLRLPLEWQALDDPPSAALLDRLEKSNEAVFDMLFKSVDLGTAPIEDEALAEALKPLRVKIDMIIEMLARLSYRDQQLPEPREVELGLSHLAWSQPEPPALDSWLLAKLYFHDVFREPVTLAGRVTACSAEPQRGTRRCTIALAEMSENLSESFARLVFLEHRRRLAHDRAVTGRSPV